MRLAAKAAAVTALARVSGISWRKGLLTGLALMPLSVFVILLLEEHALILGIDLVDQLAPLAAATLLLELIGPGRDPAGLRLAGETIAGAGALRCRWKPFAAFAIARRWASSWSCSWSA